MNESDQTARSESLLEEAHRDQAIPMQLMSSHERSSATVDPSESISLPLPRISIEPWGTRDGQWPQSNFHYWREDTLSQMEWSVDGNEKPGRQNYARAYVFRWSDISGQQQCDMCEFSQTDGKVDDAAFEADIQQWIAETRHQETVTIRVFVSYLVWTAGDAGFGPALTRGAFEAIEKDFELHPATTRTFPLRQEHYGIDFTWPNQKESIRSHGDNVWLVSHFEPISAEGWVISLRYDRQRQHTDAMILTGRRNEFRLNQALDELMILHESWNEFRVLPEVLLQVCLKEWVISVQNAQTAIANVERRLGASRTWESGVGAIDESWPQNIDVRQVTVDLHETLFSIALNRKGLQKVKQIRQRLEELEFTTKDTQAIPPASSAGARQLDQYSTWTDTLLQRTHDMLVATHERAQIQADLLFSMVSQKDSREGISMAQSAFVFTFITALFLPCTVVASIFSMSMFDWQPDTESGSTVSNKFWIYWAFSLPLTIIVMGGWYWWSVKGMKMWNRSSSEDNTDAQGLRAKSRWVRFLGKRPKTKNA